MNPSQDYHVIVIKLPVTAEEPVLGYFLGILAYFLSNCIRRYLFNRLLSKFRWFSNSMVYQRYQVDLSTMWPRLDAKRPLWVSVWACSIPPLCIPGADIVIHFPSHSLLPISVRLIFSKVELPGKKLPFDAIVLWLELQGTNWPNECDCLVPTCLPSGSCVSLLRLAAAYRSVGCDLFSDELGAACH